MFLINEFSHSAPIDTACSVPFISTVHTEHEQQHKRKLLRFMYSVLILFFIGLIGCSLEKEFWSKKKKKSSTIKCDKTGVSKVRKKSKCDASEDQEIQAIGGKDASIFLFHALGKIIYCKSKKTLT